MQTRRSINILTSEWRWVVIISSFLVTLTLVPYAWALASNESDDGLQFMGMLSQPVDGAAYLSKIEQGRQGAWLFEFRYTPEAHDRIGIHTVYIVLGHVARITGLPNVVIYHLARIMTSFFMFVSFYELGAAVWVRLRPRRVFFVLLALGSGIGWLWLLVSSDTLAADLWIPEAFPFLAAYTNPHFPLSIACLTLIASIYIRVFQRGYKIEPHVNNGGLSLLLLTLILVLVQPSALFPISSALVCYVLARSYLTRKFPVHELRWSSMLWLPVLPFAIFDYSMLQFNDIMGAFNQQYQAPSPAPQFYLLGYGVLLIVALPGLIRAFRHFEHDGNQLMLLWLIVNVISLYIPLNLQRRLTLGLVIPLVYFSVRSLEDYWFHKIAKKWCVPVMIVLVALMVPTLILNLSVPLFGAVFSPEDGVETGMLVETDYWHTLQWLRDYGDENAVVLASPEISLWIPAYTRQIVVYGHPFETIPNKERLTQIKMWYRGQDCETLLSTTLPFHIRYIIWGPQERALGTDEDDKITYPNIGKCVEDLSESRIEQQIAQGNITIYVLK